MAFDEARGEIVLFGGSSEQGFLNDTWAWDGTDWTQRTPAHSPRPVHLSAMTYDSPRQQTVLFGGYGEGGPDDMRSDTWVWDGADWTEVVTTNSPPPRQSHAMVFDASRGEVLLFGGVPANFGLNLLRDTWVWDGSDWAQRLPATSPSSRCCQAMAYDSAHQQVVLFGGDTGNLVVGDVFADDTWLWDGTSWVQASAVDRPGARLWPAMAYDAIRGEVVLFGGLGLTLASEQETWIWSPVTVFPQ